MWKEKNPGSISFLFFSCPLIEYLHDSHSLDGTYLGHVRCLAVVCVITPDTTFKLFTDVNKWQMMPQVLLSVKLSLHACHNRQQVKLKNKWLHHMKISLIVTDM